MPKIMIQTVLLPVCRFNCSFQRHALCRRRLEPLHKWMSRSRNMFLCKMQIALDLNWWTHGKASLRGSFSSFRIIKSNMFFKLKWLMARNDSWSATELCQNTSYNVVDLAFLRIVHGRNVFEPSSHESINQMPVKFYASAMSLTFRIFMWISEKKDEASSSVRTVLSSHKKRSPSQPVSLLRLIN